MKNLKLPPETPWDWSNSEGLRNKPIKNSRKYIEFTDKEANELQKHKKAAITHQSIKKLLNEYIDSIQHNTTDRILAKHLLKCLESVVAVNKAIISLDEEGA